MLRARGRLSIDTWVFLFCFFSLISVLPPATATVTTQCFLSAGDHVDDFIQIISLATSVTVLPLFATPWPPFLQLLGSLQLLLPWNLQRGDAAQAPGAGPVLLQPRDPLRQREARCVPRRPDRPDSTALNHSAAQSTPSPLCHVVFVPLPCFTLLSRPSKGYFRLTQRWTPMVLSPPDGLSHACFCRSPVTLASSHHASNLPEPTLV